MLTSRPTLPYQQTGYAYRNVFVPRFFFLSLSLYNPLSDGVTLSSSIRRQLKLLGNLLPSLVIAAEKAYSAFWLGDGKRREEGVGRRVINAAGPVQYSLCFLFVLCPEPGHIKSVGGCVRQKKTGG